MGRGRSSSSGRGSSSSSSRGSSSSSRGSSRSSWRSSNSNGRTVIWHTSSHHHGGGSFSLLPIAVILIAIGAIALFIVVPTIFTGFKYGEVSAECVENELRDTWYYTTYEYEVDGVQYESESQEGWEFPEAVGKIVTIYYLKDDPAIITEENPGFTSSDVPMLACGIGFVGVGIGLILLNKKLKAKKQAQQIESSQTSLETTDTLASKPAGPEKIKCPYCGSKYNSNASACPNCGASSKQ